MRHTRARAAAIAAAALLLLGAPGDARAQLKGHYLPGFTGLRNGTQPPPGVAFILPAYFYSSDDIRDDVGEAIDTDLRVNVSLLSPGLTWTTNKRLLGGRVGGSILPLSFVKSRLEGNSLDVNSSVALTDLELQPLQLGWTSGRADFVAGYAVFVPIGEWELGGDDNAGLGMWSHLFQAGGTFHPDKDRLWSVSSLASWETHTEKRGTDIRVGDILTVEGGIGRSFIRAGTIDVAPIPTLVLEVGAVYYGQIKLTEDRGGPLTPLLEGRKDRVWGAGLEGNLAFVEHGLVFGLRAAPEFAARNRTQGWTFVITTAYQLARL